MLRDDVGEHGQDAQAGQTESAVPLHYRADNARSQGGGESLSGIRSSMAVGNAELKVGDLYEQKQTLSGDQLPTCPPLPMQGLPL